jgi:hypothetical protein
MIQSHPTNPKGIISGGANQNKCHYELSWAKLISLILTSGGPVNPMEINSSG